MQPSLKRPKAISVRTFRAMMSGRGTSAPRAMPGVGALGLALVWMVVDVFEVVVLMNKYNLLKIRRPILPDRVLEHDCQFSHLVPVLFSRFQEKVGVEVDASRYLQLGLISVL